LTTGRFYPSFKRRWPIIATHQVGKGLTGFLIAARLMLFLAADIVRKRSSPSTRPFMSIRGHSLLLAQAVAVWFAFWLLGLPAYYQQYSAVALAVASVLLSIVIALAAIAVLRRGTSKSRFRRAFWLSVYYTVPFALLDTWYCGFYLGHGSSYLWKYWYLTVFYFTPWVTFIPVAVLLGNEPEKANAMKSAGRGS
jgi:uncharacterized membrane protein